MEPLLPIPVNRIGPPLKVCLVSGPHDYDSDETILAFADFLLDCFNVQVNYHWIRCNRIGASI